jgi:hypothetical protein
MNNLRKYIRESIERLISESDGGLVGMEIVNIPPFSTLPENRRGVDWKNRGEAYLPSVDSNGKTQIFSKEDLFGYVNEFMKKYGEEPRFSMANGAIQIINEPYIKFQTIAHDALSSFGTEGD